MHSKQRNIMKLRIKEIMTEKNVTSVWLANEIGVTKATISNLINDKTMPSIETIENIAKVLQVPMWQIFASPEEVLNTSEACEAAEEEYVFKCPNCGAKFKKI